jgi:hypothetical protein
LEEVVEGKAEYNIRLSWFQSRTAGVGEAKKPRPILDKMTAVERFSSDAIDLVVHIRTRMEVGLQTEVDKK